MGVYCPAHGNDSPWTLSNMCGWGICDLAHKGSFINLVINYKDVSPDNDLQSIFIENPDITGTGQCNICTFNTDFQIKKFLSKTFCLPEVDTIFIQTYYKLNKSDRDKKYTSWMSTQGSE